MGFCTKRKGMELAMNTVVILVVPLVLISILLILLSGNGSKFSDFGGEKISAGSDTTECELLCWECCHGVGNEIDCSNPLDDELKICNCIDTKPTIKNSC